MLVNACNDLIKCTFISFCEFNRIQNIVFDTSMFFYKKILSLKYGSYSITKVIVEALTTTDWFFFTYCHCRRFLPLFLFIFLFLFLSFFFLFLLSFFSLSLSKSPFLFLSLHFIYGLIYLFIWYSFFVVMIKQRGRQVLRQSLLVSRIYCNHYLIIGDWPKTIDILWSK